MFLALGLTAAPAWAYGDPNSAGLLYQALMPLLAMAAIGYRALKHRIHAAFKWLTRHLFGKGGIRPDET